VDFIYSLPTFLHEADVERRGILDFLLLVEVVQSEAKSGFIDQYNEVVAPMDTSETEIGLEELLGSLDIGNGKIDVIQFHNQTSIGIVG
jgi:hypothetical protein